MTGYANWTKTAKEISLNEFRDSKYLTVDDLAKAIGVSSKVVMDTLSRQWDVESSMYVIAHPQYHIIRRLPFWDPETIQQYITRLRREEEYSAPLSHNVLKQIGRRDARIQNLTTLGDVALQAGKTRPAVVTTFDRIKKRGVKSPDPVGALKIGGSGRQPNLYNKDELHEFFRKEAGYDL